MANQHVNKFVLGGETVFDLSGDTVTADKLAKGVTAHDKAGAPVVGTNTYDSDTTDDTLAVAEALEGKTFHARGQKYTGTMPNKGAVTLEIADKDGAPAIPQGYHDGSGKAQISATEKAKLLGSNIKQGITILGVEGTYGGEAVKAQANKAVTPSMSEQVVTPDTGYDYLAQVTVGAIPITYTDNAAGGQTVTIG